jgi:hypothetical protein
VIPYFAIFLRDLTLLELSNPDFLPDSKYLNWPKFRMISEQLQSIGKYQTGYHRFLPNRTVQEFLLLEPTEKITSDLLHKKSRAVQPSAEVQ